MKRYWVALTVALTGCSFRIDWPKHDVFITIEEPGLQAWDQKSLTQLRVTIDSVRLIPCEEEIPQGYALWDLLVPSANAHGFGSPTELKVPGIMRFLGERSQYVLGVLEPPPNTYCEVLIGFAPADNDALGDSKTMEGVSLSADFEDQRLTSVLKADVRRTLVPPLILPDSYDVALSLTLSVDNSLTHVSLPGADSPDWEVSLWGSILESLHVVVEEVP